MKVLGWKNETTYGESLITPPDDWVFRFGKDNRNTEIPIPWEQYELTPVWDLGKPMATELIEGIPTLDDIRLKVSMVGAEEFRYLLGNVTANVFTAGLAMPSRSVYIQTDFDDIVELSGCVTKSMDIFLDRGWTVDLEIRMMAATAHVIDEINGDGGDVARYNSDLRSESPWGWSNRHESKLDAATIHGKGDITRIHFHVENILNVFRDEGVPVNVKKKATAVEVDFDITNALPDNPIVAAMRTRAEDAFYYSFSRGTTDTLRFDAGGIRFGSMRAMDNPFDTQGTTYTVVGAALGADAFKVTINDGVTY